MTTAEYLNMLKKLGLSPHAKETARVLGVSLRMVQYYANGRPIPKPVAMLLRHYEISPKLLQQARRQS